MDGRKRKTTSLWSVIELLQKRFEAQGLDHRVVDQAVMVGLEAWFDTVPPIERAHRRHGRFPIWAPPPTIKI